MALLFQVSVCWNCGRPALETCSGCNLAKYCSRFCQHKDWDTHHRVCTLASLNGSLAKADTKGAHDDKADANVTADKTPEPRRRRGTATKSGSGDDIGEKILSFIKN
jgi:hypothetical protein